MIAEAPNGHVVIATGLSDESVDRALALAMRVVGGVELLAAELARAELGAIDLPPSVGAPADRAHIQTVAPLYLAAELDAAHLLTGVEALAGLFANGGLNVEQVDAGRLLHAFWQGRNQRFAAPERQSFFVRLFGTPGGTPNSTPSDIANSQFEPLFIELASALAQYDSSVTSVPLVGDTAVRTAARELLANLLPRSGGMALFVARDLITTLNAAVAILKQPMIQRSVGGHGVWDTLRLVSEHYLHQTIDVQARLTRGKSGMLILTWLAEIVPTLEDTSRRMVDARHQSILAAAMSWLQASLPLYEQHPTGGGAA